MPAKYLTPKQLGHQNREAVKPFGRDQGVFSQSATLISLPDRDAAKSGEDLPYLHAGFQIVPKFTLRFVGLLRIGDDFDGDVWSDAGRSITSWNLLQMLLGNPRYIRDPRAVKPKCKLRFGERTAGPSAQPVLRENLEYRRFD